MECPICGKVCSKFGFKNHIRLAHEENPLRGKPSWNSGQTKNSDPRIRDYGKKRSTTISESGSWWSGKSHSLETKKKISESALKSSHQRVTSRSITFKKKDGTVVFLDSSYEQLLAEILERNDISWIRPKPFKWTDSDGKIHNYFPDFFLTDFNIYLDPKNEFVLKRDEDKIRRVISENDISLVVLRKQDITEEFILRLISGISV